MQKKDIPVLKIFLMSQPLANTEWSSLLGDKYLGSTSFRWEFVENIQDSEVIAWDGVITPKFSIFKDQIFSLLASGRVLLIQGEARTLYKSHPFVELFNLESVKLVELPGWSVLPEEMISALELCRQKLGHV